MSRGVGRAAAACPSPRPGVRHECLAGKWSRSAPRRSSTRNGVEAPSLHRHGAVVAYDSDESTNLVLDEHLLEEAVELGQRANVRGGGGSCSRGLRPRVPRASHPRSGRVRALGGRSRGDARRPPGPAGAAAPAWFSLTPPVWIEVFRRPSRLTLGAVAELDDGGDVPPDRQEVLQGFRDEAAFKVARDAMLAFPIVESPLRWEVFDEEVRRHGQCCAPRRATLDPGRGRRLPDRRHAALRQAPRSRRMAKAMSATSPRSPKVVPSRTLQRASRCSVLREAGRVVD